MRNSIAQISYQNGLGIPSGRKLFRVETGEYAGRLLAVFRESHSELQFVFADAPYNAWSTPTTIAADTSSFPFDAVMSPDGTVWITYTEQTSEYVVVRKMTFDSGVWTVGPKVYAYVGSSFAPSIVIDSSGKFWLGFSRLNVGFYDIQVKSSEDSGVTWGSGSSDLGDTLHTALYVPFVKLMVSANQIYAIYNGTLTDLYMRRKSLSDATWGEEQLVANGNNLDEHFDVALSADGLLSIVYNTDRLFYREFDGANWTAQIELDANRGSSPQLYFSNSVPTVMYLKAVTDDETSLMFVRRSAGQFSAPAVLESRAGAFDRLLVYDAGTASYQDCTLAADDDNEADLFHAGSGVLLSSQRDAILTGLSEKFRVVNVHLSIPGSGGTVSYAYWDGTGWKSFTPHDGIFNFDSSTRQLTLWKDLASVPVDWQKCSVEGQSMFWLRIEVTGNFTTPPIGSQLNSRSLIDGFILRR